MAEGRRGLGRGLSALLEEASTATTPEARAASGVREVSIELIHRNPEQPRKAFDPEALEELAASIRERGVIAPIVLRPLPDRNEEFQIVAGERRWRAAQAAALRTIPAVVRDLTDQEVMEVALIENLQREDLNPLEEARGYASIEARFGHNAEAISKVIGKSRSHVSNTLRLMRLPDSVKAHVEAGALSAGHARALLDFEDAAALAERVVAEGLNVRQTETLAKAALKGGAAQKGKRRRIDKDVDTLDLETTLSNALGMPVEIEDRGGKGELRLKYGTLEQLDEVCAKLMR